MLAQALKRSQDDQTIDDVKRAVERSEAQLWVTDRTAVVTVVSAPDIHVWLYGGSLADMPVLFDSAKAWALKIGLKYMTVGRARRGWERVLIPLGFEKGSDCNLICKLGD